MDRSRSNPNPNYSYQPPKTPSWGSTPHEPEDHQDFQSYEGDNASRGPTRRSKSFSGKGRMFGKVHKVVNWLGTSEPSTQALKQHKKQAYQKAGIPLTDPRDLASAKLHAPLGEIPEDAVKSVGGPSPEEALRKKTSERRRRQRRDEPYKNGNGSGGGGSGNSAAASFNSFSSSGISSSGGSLNLTSTSSMSRSTAVPWEDLQLDEWKDT